MIRAVLGGSFDPVHDGHLALAHHLLDTGLADRLVVVPARISPHKDKAHAGTSDRLDLVRLQSLACGCPAGPNLEATFQQPLLSEPTTLPVD